MTWDYAEANPLAELRGDTSSESIDVDGRERGCTCDESVGDRRFATQADATVLGLRSAAVVVSTDPPYYDNIGYADLSDFFYVWLRRSLCRTSIQTSSGPF